MVHKNFLLKTLALAELRRGFCAPNPSVGAILVKNGQIIAEGFHFQAGSPHAEPSAIDKAGFDAKSATLYVSLEPCNHWGKTPPCTNKILAAGIKEVYFAHKDPNSLVLDKTIPILNQANILCEYISLAEADTFYESYDYWVKHRYPFVTAKIALSLDAKIAQANGIPASITGQKLQNLTHQFRKRSDILLTTKQTLINDNPKLNARVGTNSIGKPIAVLARDGQLPKSLNIFNTAAKIIIFFDETVNLVTRMPNVDYYGVPTTIEGLDLRAILNKLGELGYHDVWVEAGGKCFSGFLKKNLINRAYLYYGSIWLGHHAISAFSLDSNEYPKPNKILWQSFGANSLCRLDF